MNFQNNLINYPFPHQDILRLHSLVVKHTQVGAAVASLYRVTATPRGHFPGLVREAFCGRQLFEPTLSHRLAFSFASSMVIPLRSWKVKEAVLNTARAYFTVKILHSSPTANSFFIHSHVLFPLFLPFKTSRVAPDSTLIILLISCDCQVMHQNIPRLPHLAVKMPMSRCETLLKDVQGNAAYAA
jgi:hypothetical protein